MKKINEINKTMNLLITVSLIYAVIEMRLEFLAPIATIIIPYKFMKYKDNESIRNDKLINNLFIFNLIVFLSVIFITKNVNHLVISIIANISIAFIYYKISYFVGINKKVMYEDPKLLYNELMKRVIILEKVYLNTEEEIRNAKTEKAKEDLMVRLNLIGAKIEEIRLHIKILDKQIKEDNLDNNK